MKQHTTLSLDSIHFDYDKTPVLKGVSFSVKQGEFTAIIGPNGCGKSTALKLLAGLIPAKSGCVYLNDQPLNTMNRRQIAQQLALLTQSGDVPATLSVMDLVGMGRFSWESWLRRKTPEDQKWVERAMRLMEVDELAARQVSSLSGGQLQRVRMAMTLAQNAPVLLLDEPTNHLDLKHQHALLNIARQQAQQGRTVVAVLHDLAQASIYADQLVLLHEGQVEAIGSPQEVITPAAIEKVYGITTDTVQVGRAVIPIPQEALL